MLNNIGLPGLILILVVVVLLFGRGKISQLMGDVAKGIKSFKKGMAEDPDEIADKTESKSGDTIDVTPKQTDKV